MAGQTQDKADAVMDRLATILEQQQAQAPPFEPGIGHPEFQRRLEAEDYFAEINPPAFQNGREVNARMITQENRVRINQLKPGMYCNGKVEVLKDAKGRVHLRYRSMTPEQRMEFGYTVARSLNELIEKIWAEQGGEAAA